MNIQNDDILNITIDESLDSRDWKLRKEKRRKHKRRIYLLISISIIILFSGIFLIYKLFPPANDTYWAISSRIIAQMEEDNDGNQPNNPSLLSTESISESILSYLANPMFINENFTEMITNTKAEFELYDINNEMIYWSHSLDDFNREKVLGLLTTHPEKVEYAVEKNNVLQLGKYKYSNKDRIFFRFPSRDFQIDKDKIIKTDFDNVSYTLTMGELSGYILNWHQYNGHKIVIIGYNGARKRTVVNHCPWITRNGEPSLQRFVKKLIGGTSLTKEKSAQILLDFVTTQIKYNYREALARGETMKRANEVLMTKTADCSGKAVLYASMLEQLEIPYLLVYYRNHIAVAVEGKYRNHNDLVYSFGTKKYAIAETTMPNFQIGKTPLMSRQAIKYLQKPGGNQKFYSIEDGEPLRFDQDI